MISSSLPFSPVQTVKPEWIDFNGHLNMAYYMVLFDKGLDWHFDQFGMGPDYITRVQKSCFAVEAKIKYLREIMVGERVLINMRILDLAPKAVHYGSEMVLAKDQTLICTMEGVSLHMDMTTRKVAPFMPDIYEKLEILLENHQKLPRNPHFGGDVSIKKR